MKAYSLDLRQKIVDAYAEGKISQRQLAKQFRVALSFIEKLVTAHRNCVAVSPMVAFEQTGSNRGKGLSQRCENRV